MQASQLIDMFENAASALPAAEGALVNMWCKTARFAAVIRNDIAHGVPANMGGSIAFMRNPTWHGEQRKRAFSDFWIEPSILEMTTDSFAVLLRTVVAIERGQLTQLA